MVPILSVGGGDVGQRQYGVEGLTGGECEVGPLGTVNRGKDRAGRRGTPAAAARRGAES